MDEDFADERPEADADLFLSRPLPEDGQGVQMLFAEMAGIMRDNGAEEMRATIVSPEYPMPPYPDGLYMEGWLVAPHRMEIPHEAAPFNFPVKPA